MDWEALCSTSCRLVPPPNSARRRYRGARPVGSNRKRELLRPQIGVVTTVGGDHYKTFSSLEATAKEKGRLAEISAA